MTRLSVLIAVTHLLGVGHLTRAAAIARALARAGHDVVVASGGMPAPLVSTGDARLLQLPPVRSDGLKFSNLLAADGEPADAAYLARRIADLETAVSELRPDIVMTELYPFGRWVLRHEMAALVAKARSTATARRSRALVVSSIRDILATPSKQERIGVAHDILAADFDAVLVHADPQIVPLDASWPLPEELEPKLVYTGYVDNDDAPRPADDGTPVDILVSAGGSAVGLDLYRLATRAARLRPHRHWRILVGHGVAEGDFQALRAEAPANAAVERARPDFRALLARAAISINQIGYNTALDLLATRVRSVVVPFAQGTETEQALRARLFAARGLASTLPEQEASPETLLAAIDRAEALPPPAALALARDGAVESAHALVRLATTAS